MSKKNNRSNEIIEVVDNFNWEKVHNYMTQNHWTWDFGSDGNGNRIRSVPNIDILKKTAHRLLAEAVKIKGFSSTGGLYATCSKDELSLFFYIEAYQTGLV
jgi:hypothetical protein